MKPTSGIMLYPFARHKHAFSDKWERGHVTLKVDIFFSQKYIRSQSNLTAYKMKQMDIFALVDDGIQKNVIILQMLSVICLQMEKEKK